MTVNSNVGDLARLPWTLIRRAGVVGVALLVGLQPIHASRVEGVPVIRVAPFELPRYSDYLSRETRAGLERSTALYARARSICDPTMKVSGAEIRACESRMYPLIIAEARKRYSVQITATMIGGVQTDIVVPAEGVSAKNSRRVLINMHGGGFKYGARFGGQLEAMPIAAIGKYKVVAVDYRMAPEHHFPAASIDLAAVYNELLKEYEPSNIGFFGCSAGARIIGQAVAWMSERKVPSPGAVSILCSAPTGFGGDSNIIVAALENREPTIRRFDEGYFKGVSPTDPVAFPGDSDEMLSRFPPVLLMTSTRDYSMSPVIRMHSRLVRLGVPTELHIYEGLRHGEFLNMFIPESLQAASVISSFFDKHLSAAEQMSANHRPPPMGRHSRR